MRVPTRRISLALCAMMLACSGPESEVRSDGVPAEGAERSLRQVQDLAQAIVEHFAFEPMRDAGPPDAAALVHLGEFDLTYYWMAREREEPGDLDVPLYDRHCEPLAMVSQAFADRLVLEGTGRLRDGRILNVARRTCACDGSSRPCFFEVGRKKRWGVGVAKRPLSPYRSVAVDTATIPIGSKLYIPELDGLTMPGRKPYGGFVHDGCVVADDTGGNVGSQQIDLFMALEPHYQAFDRRHRLKRIQVYDGSVRCQEPATEETPVHRNST